jgi:transposase-like protein
MARIYIEGHFYPESLKEQVIREYQSGYSMSYLRGKYGIRGANTIRRWLHAKGLRTIPRKNYLATVKSPSSHQANDPAGSVPDVAQLQQQLKAAQRQLEDAQIKAEMLERLIELAEQRHQISIRKKGGTR